ncbi:unnamed protein product [Trifolium pratense]|uniref:Uncharacterized protein n=1 Tax=Trifolium pratense TaxID=57577 RepID=A0ACB0K4Q0_TRIPR|nr:unnamed protein product [Trifolium pratense]
MVKFSLVMFVLQGTNVISHGLGGASLDVVLYGRKVICLSTGMDSNFSQMTVKLLGGYKQGNGIVCGCCDVEISPSQFEAHAGMAAWRQPGHHLVEDQKATETQTDTPENVDSLINCVMKNIGFHHGKPIAAFTIYKCLLHWKSFEAERTSVFDRFIEMIGSAIEARF